VYVNIINQTSKRQNLKSGPNPNQHCLWRGNFAREKDFKFYRESTKTKNICLKLYCLGNIVKSGWSICYLACIAVLKIHKVFSAFVSLQWFSSLT